MKCQIKKSGKKKKKEWKKKHIETENRIRWNHNDVSSILFFIIFFSFRYVSFCCVIARRFPLNSILTCKSTVVNVTNGPALLFMFVINRRTKISAEISPQHRQNKTEQQNVRLYFFPVPFISEHMTFDEKENAEKEKMMMK